jgi:hypothetical protein
MTDPSRLCAEWKRSPWAAMPLIAIYLFLAASPMATADEIDKRTFAISVDGKPSKDSFLKLTINDHGGDHQTVEVHASVDVRVFFVHYTYRYDGTEEWKNGRLMKLESQCNDDGTRMSVNAEADGNDLKVRTRTQETKMRWDVWTTTYWQLPSQFRNKGVPMIDADTGKYLNGFLQFVGNENVMVNGGWTPCAHYRVTADKIDVNVWYDNHDRLVRQTSKEQGHTTLFTLQPNGR